MFAWVWVSLSHIQWALSPYQPATSDAGAHSEGTGLVPVPRRLKTGPMGVLEVVLGCGGPGVAGVGMRSLHTLPLLGLSPPVAAGHM